jgi:NAD(P)-dependent dehydrogenase (short-subunit alcohol dehydrogenase family)
LRGLVGGFSTASDSQRLAGKVAVITGAASGIGKATAAEFVRNGARVILADVQDDAGRAVAAELGAAASYTRCDVTGGTGAWTCCIATRARRARRCPRRWRRWTSRTSTV